MTRDELIEELVRRTGIDENVLRLKSDLELEDLYDERVLKKGMI
ncbi:hypothetical protein [Bacillus niameyensis]|nr:hypothetical protein [Bacillus niameyensis]